jgi:DNA-directed RNA polymerase subunit RPC12/RpoP
MTYICRWCDNNFEESGTKDPETEFKNGVLCCPRCGNITYGFLVYKNDQ